MAGHLSTIGSYTRPSYSKMFLISSLEIMEQFVFSFLQDGRKYGDEYMAELDYIGKRLDWYTGL